VLIEELAPELDEVFCETGIASVVVGKHDDREILLVNSWLDGIGKVARMKADRPNILELYRPAFSPPILTDSITKDQVKAILIAASFAHMPNFAPLCQYNFFYTKLDEIIPPSNPLRGKNWWKQQNVLANFNKREREAVIRRNGNGEAPAFQMTSAITPSRYTVIAAPKEVLILSEHPFEFSPFPAFLTVISYENLREVICYLATAIGAHLGDILTLGEKLFCEKEGNKDDLQDGT
jgi:hypothetical protein